MNIAVLNQSYTLRDSRTYMLGALFVAGNVILPQLCHLIPQGGLIWLPIYLFTFIGAWRCGLTVGLLTAILSPLVNSALFGMPMPAALPAIMAKSVLLALAASFAASRKLRHLLPAIVAVAAFYQGAGMLFEWAVTGSATAALQDVRIGLPGIIAQIAITYLWVSGSQKASN